MSNTMGLIECRRADLLSALEITCLAVWPRNTIPVLGNVLIQASNKTITVESTDLDVTVKTRLNRTGKDKKPVATTLPAKELLAFCKAAGGDELWIRVEESQASIHAGASRSLPTIIPSDFPKDREYDTPVRFTTDIGSFLSALEIVRPAISIDETRYYLNGIFFEPTNMNMLKLVATDGHRMHLTTMNADGIAANTATRVIVPSVTLRILVAYLKKALREWKKSKEPQQPMTVEFGQTGINFLHGAVVIRSKVIDGTFPDYNRVIPTNNNNKATIDAKAIDAAIKTAHSPKHRIGVKLSFKNDGVEVSTDSHDSGKVSSRVSCAYDGPFGPMESDFNGKYMRDAIAALGGNGLIEIVMGDPGSPAIWRMGNDNTMIVLMPRRV